MCTVMWHCASQEYIRHYITNTNRRDNYNVPWIILFFIMQNELFTKGNPTISLLWNNAILQPPFEFTYCFNSPGRQQLTSINRSVWWPVSTYKCSYISRKRWSVWNRDHNQPIIEKNTVNQHCNLQYSNSYQSWRVGWEEMWMRRQVRRAGIEEATH